MWVVKLGGSLAGSAALRDWIDAIKDPAAAAVVVVPGGGPWADAVRDTQLQMGFSDRCAHGMALKAMEQFGLLLCDLSERLRPCASVVAIRSALDRGRVPVWMPADMLLAQRAPIPMSWDVTADSLAAWLAGTLQATTLVLVKSVDVERGSLPALVDGGVVDPCFPQLLAAAGCAAYVTGRKGCAAFRAACAGDGGPGLRLTVDPRTPKSRSGSAP